MSARFTVKNMGKTIFDVAVAAGVSTATVSRALSRDRSERVTEKTRVKITKIAEQLGYRANHAARSLKRQSTMTIAVVVPELINDFFMEVAEGIERELDQNGYTMLLAASLNSVEEEKKRISTLEDRTVDGMVVIPSASMGEHLQALSDRGVPVVLVDRIVEGAELDAVLSDNEGGMFKLTKALLSDGFRRIAFVGGDLTASTARERLSGYARALAEAGITPEPGWVCLGGMNVEDGYRRMEDVLKGGSVPEAAVAVNLLVHLGMERRLSETASGVVIAGFDESGYTPFLPACRYIAAQDTVGMGKRAGKRILELVAEKKNNRTYAGRRIIRLPVTIIRP
ncbi:MAG: LacI family transcriptional regulator [Treponema sp.]|jgi:LacI family transcriptional regulator|nr:LacI family transcriptional regulator [Treponema sp.]